MSVMDIEARKAEMLEILDVLLTDIETLTDRVYTTIEDLYTVKTKEDAIRFDETHDLEAGLVYIRLF